MPKTFILSLASLWFAVAAVHAAITTDANDGLLFQFKFATNKPLIYAVENKTRQMNDSQVGQRSSLTRTTVDTRYKIRLTAVGTSQGGTTAVYFEPFDFEQDTHIVGPAGQMDATTRGLTILTKQNGVVMVDTEKGLGLSQSQNMKQAIYPHLLTGYMDFEPNGHIKNFEGDLPFIDTWQNNLKYNMNLFYVVFPTNTIAVHDTWTNYYSIKTVGPVVFNGDGIVQQWSYVRELDQTTTNGPVACFSLYESDDFKDLGGYLDQLGQQTVIDIPKHTESMNAMFQFDQKRGHLISMKKSDSLHEDGNMVVQGNAAESHTESETEISITLISP
jgi:hypothetical protein